MNTKNRPNIFLYQDCRFFLKDLYRYLKETHRGFSHRSFSKKAGFDSPNMLLLVIAGKRNITSQSEGRFAKGLGLNQQESDFFSSLVHFNQAVTEEKKSAAFREMTKHRKFREIHELTREIFHFYSQWFHIVIREMLNLEGFESDPAWIAQHLFPHISKEEAERALKRLLKLNLIRWNEKNKTLERSNPIVATPPEVKSLAVTKFHQAMMTLASQSLSTVPDYERDITAATVGISQKDLPQIKRKIEMFRKSLLADMEARGRRPDRIYQLNIQLFPVTEKTRDTVPKEDK